MIGLFSCVGCDRTLLNESGRCPYCSQTRIDARLKASICRLNRCGHFVVCPSGGDGCRLHPRKPGRLRNHLQAGGGCLDLSHPQFDETYKPPPVFVDLGAVRSIGFDRISEVALVTIHFNPCRFQRLRETYYEWLPTLGPLADAVRCYELVFDDDEPEIEGSVVIRGTRTKHLMWQKEALLNRALRDAPAGIRYFGWLDHDIVFGSLNWLDRAVDKIDAGAVAVQLFSEVRFLDRSRQETNSRGAAVATGSGCPGGAWIADRAYLDAIGGFNIENLFGGGDQTFLDALNGKPGWHLKEYTPKMADSLRDWIRSASEIRAGKEASFVDGAAYHLWHGDRHNRQYSTRYKLLVDEGFDPQSDVTINADGLLEWCSDKPRLHEGLRRFFENRREDG